jgi:hypothetical protein
MKEMELLAIERLIVVYSNLCKKGITKEVTEKAKKSYNEWTPGYTLLNEVINHAVGNLFSVAYPHSGSGIKKPTKEEAKEILAKLKKLKEELKN